MKPRGFLSMTRFPYLVGQDCMILLAENVQTNVYYYSALIIHYRHESLARSCVHTNEQEGFLVIACIMLAYYFINHVISCTKTTLSALD